MPEESSFISLIETHQRIIHKVCRLYMQDPQDRKDLFQEIMLAAWKSYPQFRGEARFSTWLYRVALNTAITFFRKEQRQPITAPLPHQMMQAADYNDTTEQEQLTVMHQAIAQLSAVDKALVMLYLEDYNYNEMGEMMGITPNNVAVKMNRIKTKLKQAVKTIA